MPIFPYDLTGKTAVVTGGAGILGKEFCYALASQGAKVAVVDVNLESAKECIESVLSLTSSVEMVPFECNVADPESVKVTVESIVEEFGQIDILHNNAATKTNNVDAFFSSFETYSLEVWREVMSVNLDGMFLMAQAVGSHMVKEEIAGSIIQTASIYGVVAPDQRIYEGSYYLGTKINTPAVYAVSKTAVIGLTQYLASYWGAYNIRVNTLTPGGIESGQNATFVKQYSERVPMGRMGRATELQGALLFLASSASSYITGQNIIVDGGLTCW